MSGRRGSEVPVTLFGCMNGDALKRARDAGVDCVVSSVPTIDAVLCAATLDRYPEAAAQATVADLLAV
jgi:hypothetical protein